MIIIRKTKIIFIIILINILIITGCKIDRTPVTPNMNSVTSHNYEWEIDTLKTHDAMQILMSGIWGADENNVWMVGHSDDSDYQIWYWNGIKLDNINPRIIGARPSYENVFGFSNEVFWIVGYGSYYNSNTNEITHTNYILHRVGSTWEKYEGLEAPKHCLSVWGTSSSDIFVGCDSGIVLYYDGSQWISQSTATVSRIYDIKGISQNEVYAVGFHLDKQPYDTTYHYFFKYDGISWNILDYFLYHPYGGAEYKFGYKLWISPQGNIYSAGDKGLFSWNGSSWNKILNGKFFTVYGTGENNIWVAGAFNNVYHFNGEDWHYYENISGTHQIYDIWANDKFVFMIGSFNSYSIFYRGKLKGGG